MPPWFGGAFWWLMAVAGVGWGLLCLRRPGARRASLLVAGGFVGYQVAAWSAPYFYLPQRYVFYPVPLFSMLILAVGALGFLPGSAGWLGRKQERSELSDSRRRGAVRGWARRAAVVALGGAFLFFFGTHGAQRAGVDLRVDEEAAVYRFLAELPVDSLVAGWPDGIIDNVPLLTRRRALVTYETHQAFHTGYVRRMRKRTRALIDAFLATEAQPLVRLRDEFGVSHLLIDRSVVEARELSYFRPFADPIRRAIEASRGEELEVLRQIPAAQVFDDGQNVVLDLERLEVGGVPATDRLVG